MAAISIPTLVTLLLLLVLLLLLGYFLQLPSPPTPRAELMVNQIREENVRHLASAPFPTITHARIDLGKYSTR